MRCEPRPGRDEDSTHLLRSDHLERVTELSTTFLLHLDHHDATPSPKDEVEFIAASTDICRKQSIPAQPVVAQRTALPAVHAAL